MRGHGSVWQRAAGAGAGSLHTERAMVWNLVALEPDAKRWLALRPILGQLGYRAVAVRDVCAVASLLVSFEVPMLLIRPIGDLQEHSRLIALIRKLGTRVFVTAEIAQPQILSQYYALGEQARTVRADPLAVASDLVRQARERVELLPTAPPFDASASPANDAPIPYRESTERAPGRPLSEPDHVATDAFPPHSALRAPVASSA